MLRLRPQRFCTVALLGWLLATAVAARGSATASISRDPRLQTDFLADGDRLRPGDRTNKPWWNVLGGRAHEFVNVDVPAAFDAFSQKAKFQKIVASESNWWHETVSITHITIKMFRAFAQIIAHATREAASAIAAGSKELMQRASDVSGAARRWYYHVGVPWLHESWATVCKAASVYYVAVSKCSAALACRAEKGMRSTWEGLSAGGAKVTEHTVYHWEVVLLPKLRRRAHAVRAFLRAAWQEFFEKIHMAAPSEYEGGMMADIELEKGDDEAILMAQEEAELAAFSQDGKAETSETYQAWRAQPSLRQEEPVTAVIGSGGQCRRRDVPCCDCGATWGAWQSRRRRIVTTSSGHPGSSTPSIGIPAAAENSSGAVQPLSPHAVTVLGARRLFPWRLAARLCTLAVVVIALGSWIVRQRRRFPRPRLAAGDTGAPGHGAAGTGGGGGVHSQGRARDEVGSGAPEDAHEPLPHPQAEGEALAGPEAENAYEPEFSGPESPGDSESSWVDVGAAVDEQYAPNN